MLERGTRCVRSGVRTHGGGSPQHESTCGTCFASGRMARSGEAAPFSDAGCVVGRRGQGAMRDLILQECGIPVCENV